MCRMNELIGDPSVAEASRAKYDEKKERLVEEDELLRRLVLPQLINIAKELIGEDGPFLKISKPDPYDSPFGINICLSWDHKVRKYQSYPPIWKEDVKKSVSWKEATLRVARDNESHEIIGVSFNGSDPREIGESEISKFIRGAILNPVVEKGRENGGRQWVYPEEDPRKRDMMEGYKRVRFNS